MNRLENLHSIFYWLQFVVVFLGIFYAFTFSTYHLTQVSGSAAFFNIKLPFTNGLFFYFILFFGIIFSIIRQVLNKQYYQANIFDGLLIAYVLYNVISLYWVKDYGLGFAAIINALSLYIFYYLTNSLFRGNKDIVFKILKYCVCFFTLAFIVYFFIKNYDVLLLLKNTDQSFQKIITQSKSWVGGKNQTGCFLALLLPLIVWLNLPKGTTLFFVGIISIHVLIMGSRNAYLAVGLFFIVHFIFNNIKFKQLGIVLFLASIIVLVFGSLVGFDTLFNQLKNNTYSSRFRFWQQTLNMAVDHWLLGVGTGQWDAYKLQYNVWFVYIHPHNDFIRNFAELGIVGFFLFYSIISTAFWKSYKNLSQNKKVAAIAINTLCVYLCLSFFDELKMKLNFNILLALTFALINYHFSFNTKKKFKPAYTRYLLNVFLCFSALYLVVYPLKLEKEMQHFKKYRIYLKQKEKALAVEELKKVNKTIINNIGGKSMNTIIANTYYNGRNIDSAAIYFEKVAKENPYYSNQLKSLAYLNWQSNENQQVWRQVSKLFLMNPCSEAFADTSIRVESTRKSRYFENMVKRQQAKCENE